MCRLITFVESLCQIALDDASHDFNAGGQRRFVYVEARRVMRVREAARFVARAQKEITARHALQEITHVFAAHRAHTLIADDMVTPDDFGSAAGDQFANFSVIDERWRL